jgi:hypothetical protein
MGSLAIASSAATVTALALGAFVATEAQAKTATMQSPDSLACSKQADAKGLHGKERKKFRAECKQEMKAKGPTPAAGKTPTTPAPAKAY